MKHLSEKTKVFVEQSNIEERLKSARAFKWVGYTHAQKMLNIMESFLDYPKSHRMPNLLLVGDSNNGKTAILNRFNQRHVATLDESTDELINPVLLIQAPPEPDERRFYNAILEKLYAPYRTTEKIDSRYIRVKNILKDLKTRVLIIDEIHHVLAGSPSRQRKFLNVIKHLSNDLQIPLVCSGTKLAFNAIQSDHQLANRFEPRILPRWSNNTELKRLLLSFERMLPLKKESNLIENSISSKVLSMSDGLIGEISKILELATVLAIEHETERITKTILNEIDYVSPQERKKAFFL